MRPLQLGNLQPTLACHKDTSALSPTAWSERTVHCGKGVIEDFLQGCPAWNCIGVLQQPVSAAPGPQRGR